MTSDKLTVALAPLILSTLMLWAGPAAANLRAPREVHQSPSSTIYRTTGPLVVKGEDLSFVCSRQSCMVTAVYRVQAPRATSLPLEFICPGKNTLKVKVGSSKLAPAKVTSAPLSAAERKRVEAGMGGFGRHRSRLHKARFQVDLRPGLNHLRISYLQRLSALERDYGYFKDGRFMHRLQYELWPLKGWKLDPEFKLRLKVKLKRQAPSWWKRTFGTVTSLACVKQGKGKAITVKPTQQGGHLVLAATMGANFPDRLTCRIGDQDLL